MDTENMGGVSTIEETETIVSHMPLYKVIMHNDPKTTMEFVVEVLTTIFRKNLTDAAATTLDIHNKGLAIVGIYPFEHAEMKIDSTHSLARGRGYPLTCTMEKA